MALLDKLQKLFDAVLICAAFLSGVIFGLVTLFLCIDISMRYFFNRPITGVLEISEYSLLFFTLLGAPWLLKRDKHVKMDLVISKLKPIKRASVNVVTSLLDAIVCAIITYYGILAVIERYKTGYRLPTTLEPLSYPLMSIIPLCFFLLFIQFLLSAYRNFADAKSVRKKVGRVDTTH
jgi:TRAP-type C4-dicarboxylate transport system permease small subunit